MSTRPTRLSRHPSPFAIAVAVILLLWAATVFGDEPRATIKAPALAKVATLVVLDATESTGDAFVWESTTGESFAVDTNGKRAYFVASAPGKYRFLLVAAGVVECKARLDKALIEVVVDGVIPQPQPIPTPTPTPPVPPPPLPPIPPAPSTAGNLRVLVLFETSANITNKQLSAITSGQVRKYLSDKCITDTDGMPAWRMWDIDVDAATESPAWQASLKAAKADPSPIPKLAIFSGTTLVKVVPLPGDDVAMLAELKKWGEK